MIPNTLGHPLYAVGPTVSLMFHDYESFQEGVEHLVHLIIGDDRAGDPCLKISSRKSAT